MWNLNDMNAYPYAGAKYIEKNIFSKIKDNNIHAINLDKNFSNCIDFNFRQLFELSLIDSNCVLQLFNTFRSYDII